MKKLRVWVLGGVLAPALACGQNLVPNGSFEAFVQCPDLPGQISRAEHWDAHRGSPDYFCSCDTGDLYSVPQNFVSDILAADGEAYAGVLAWSLNALNEREHFGVELSSPLTVGVPVFLSFKVAAARDGSLLNLAWSTNGVSMRFMYMPDSSYASQPLPNEADLVVDVAPVDSANWTTVTGLFVPDFPYTYLMIGGMFDDSLLVPVEFNANGSDDRAYMLIDEVCVSSEATDCGIDNGIDATANQMASIAPNPFSGSAVVHFSSGAGGKRTVRLFDGTGRLLLMAETTASRYLLDAEGMGLPEGAYLLSIDHGDVRIGQRLVLLHEP